MKRAFDIVASALGLLLLSPVLMVIALAVHFGDGGPALFRQVRCGRGGRPFRMLKFRSMFLDAEARGAQITVGRDPRITPVGRILRAGKLDELPQLLNVLLGEMSLVGPRPEVPRYVELYTPAQREVLVLKPGITDPASFAFIDEETLLGRAADAERFYRERLLPAKIALNLAYGSKRSFARDLLLVIATIGKLFGVHIDVLRALELPQPNLGDQ